MPRLIDAPDDQDGAAPAPHESPLRAFVPTDRALWLVVLGAAALRFWKIGAQALWIDEQFTSMVVQVRLLDLPQAVERSEGTPPLYYLGEWAWIRVFGRGDAALRSSSALVGTLTVVAMYALMVELRQSRRAARVAAVLVALNPMLIWYSREARAYASFAFLTAVGLILFVRALRLGRNLDHVLWSVAAALTFATHYFAAFLLVPQGLWLLATLWRQRRWRDAGLTFGPLGAVALALVALALNQRSELQSWIAKAPMTLRLAETGRYFVLGPSRPREILMLVAVVPLAYAAFAVVRTTDDRQRRAAAQMVGLAAVGFGLSLLVAWSYFVGRNSIGTVIVLTVPVAIGLAARPPPLGPVMTVVLCGVWLVSTVWVAVDRDLQKADWKDLATTMDQQVGQDDTVVLVDNVQAWPLPRYGLGGSRRVGPTETIRVQEINIVFHTAGSDGCSPWTGLVCEVLLWPYLPPPLQDEFTLVGRQTVDHFLVMRFRADEPVRLRPRELVDDPARALIFLLDR